jgi:hypothetical protein
MIQRIQSIYLGMVCIMTGAFINLPIYYLDGIAVLPFLNIFLSITIGLCAITALVAIFLYKNRKLQMKICWVGVLLATSSIAIAIADYISVTPKEGLSKSISYGLIFPILMIVLFLLAWNGINKDEKLVKSMDRLR